MGTELDETNEIELIASRGSLWGRLTQLRQAGRRVILVPTMGDLHAGHLSLVCAAADLGHVIVSIFVNPTQFGPGEDFEAYPRDLDADRDKLAAMGLDLSIYAPPVSEIYDPDASTWVTVDGVGDPLCGRHRPGHFRGVTTVLAKLFALVQPDVAVFGEKDAQQCLVVQRMVRDLRLPLRLVFAPTVREEDGLAMSSRNRYLNDDERRLANCLNQALKRARRLLDDGERSVASIEEAMCMVMAGVDADYAELRSVPDLAHPVRAEGHMLAAVAASVGRARLIDNFSLQIQESGVQIVPLSRVATAASVARELAQTDSTREEEHGKSS